MSVARFEELVGRAARASGLEPQEARLLVLAWFRATRAALHADKTQILPGVGTLKLKWREPYSLRNPRTGESVNVPGRYKLRFAETAELTRELTRRFGKPADRPSTPAETRASDPTTAPRPARPVAALSTPAEPAPAPEERAGPPPDSVPPVPSSDESAIGVTYDAILKNLAAVQSPAPFEAPPPPPVSAPDAETVLPSLEDVSSLSEAAPPSVPSPIPGEASQTAPMSETGPTRESPAGADPAASADFPSRTASAGKAFYRTDGHQRLRNILEGACVGLLVSILLILFVVIPLKRQPNAVRFADVIVESPNRPALREALTVRVEPGDSLSGLAARYYGNPKLWIFLWYDNQATLSSPEALEPLRDRVRITWNTNGDPAALYLRLLSERPSDPYAHRLSWWRTACEWNPALRASGHPSAPRRADGRGQDAPSRRL